MRRRIDRGDEQQEILDTVQVSLALFLSLLSCRFYAGSPQLTGCLLLLLQTHSNKGNVRDRQRSGEEAAAAARPIGLRGLELVSSLS